MIFKILKLNILFLFTLISLLNANEIKDISVKGNQRISKETILVLGNIELNKDYNSESINKVLKNLYQSDFFENIEIEVQDNTLVVNIKENPIIENISISGIKKKEFEENLLEKISLKNRSSFTNYKLENDLNLINNILKQSGYYFSDVETTINKNEDNNSVNVNLNIDLGKRAKIKSIQFIGDKKIKDRKLRNVIVSEEAKFWKFISSKKTVDIKRIKFDETLLRNFYKNRGYYNVEINSSYAQVIEDKYFEIVFNIDAGQKYYFNNLKLNLPDDYNKMDFSELEILLNELKTKPYSLNRIEDILDEVDKIALNNDYEFVSATYNENIIDNNKIDLIINLKDTEKFYVEKVNIFGNTITSERVIRNKLLTDEGDPFNEILVNKSYNNIRSLGLFKKVETSEDTFDDKKTKIINIKVEEKPTGEIFAGAGTGTSGSSLSFGVSENNYLGEGIRLGTNFSFTDDSVTAKFFLNEPNYKNSNRSFNRGFERSENDNLSSYGYKTEKTGFNLGTSYEQFKNVFFSPTLSNYYEKISTNSTASAAKKKQEGNYLDLLLDYDLTLNKLNQNFNPTDGYKIGFSQELPVYSEDYTLINRLNYTNYIETEGGTIFSIGTFIASANSLTSDDARITKRIFIPSRKLRGFEPGKIGPKDGNDFIGGNYGTSLNIASTLPGLFTEVQDLDFSFFFDAANVWGVDYSSAIDNSSKIRSSTGIALDWFTPIGPLSISYSLPLTKSSTDVTESVRFNIGTTF